MILVQTDVARYVAEEPLICPEIRDKDKIGHKTEDLAALNDFLEQDSLLMILERRTKIDPAVYLLGASINVNEGVQETYIALNAI